MNEDPVFSFVIPFKDEEEVLPLLVEQMQAFCDAVDEECEIILIDDGSRDQGPHFVAECTRTDPRFKLLRLSRNFGHQIAVTAGLDAVTGQAVITMDADLQDPPEIVHHLIKKWREGFDVVHARRRSQSGESWFKKHAASAFYRILSGLSSVEIPKNVGDFRLIDEKVLEKIRLMPERDRFLRGMFAWIGFRQTFVEFDRPARIAGQSKYPLNKMLRLALDGVVGFSDAPLRLALWIGALVSVAAFLYGSYILVLALLGGDGFVAGWASTIVILSFLSGITLMLNGVIGLYVGRILNEVKQRPLYFVSEKIGFSENSKTQRKR